MIQARLQYILVFALGTTLLIGGNMAFSFSQSNLKFDDMNLKTNFLNQSEPIYQAITGKFLAAKDLSSTPFKVAEESFLEESVMRNVGNVTNNMTFINTYLSPALVQATGKGTIETKDGQSIDWISSDIGTINSTGFFFHGIIHFNNTNSEKLSFLNNTLGIYVDTPEIKRTIWLVK
ncbi:MAG: hypothetical protein WB474_10295 [Nitrososphaeraceae archaeon]